MPQKNITMLVVLALAVVLIMIPTVMRVRSVSKSNVESPSVVGGDRDPHGCIGSAGYSWNEERQECARPWEDRVEETAAKSYQYLFESDADSRASNIVTSNIVGYFAGGAFIWYVPDWVVPNWKMVTGADGGFALEPYIRDQADDFTDIVFTIGTSTESFNAGSLHETELNTIQKEMVTLDEILLNKHFNGQLKMQIETNTRIYHITEKVSDGTRLKDIYYLDGSGKTLVITFEAKADIFSQFTDEIRKMAEGIGALQGVQG